MGVFLFYRLNLRDPNPDNALALSGTRDRTDKRIAEYKNARLGSESHIFWGDTHRVSLFFYRLNLRDPSPDNGYAVVYNARWH